MKSDTATTSSCVLSTNACYHTCCGGVKGWIIIYLNPLLISGLTQLFIVLKCFLKGAFTEWWCTCKNIINRKTLKVQQGFSRPDRETGSRLQALFSRGRSHFHTGVADLNIPLSVVQWKVGFVVLCTLRIQWERLSQSNQGGTADITSSLVKGEVFLLPFMTG